MTSTVHEDGANCSPPDANYTDKEHAIPYQDEQHYKSRQNGPTIDGPHRTRNNFDAASVHMENPTDAVESHKDNSLDPNLPIDRGWAWVVLLASTIEMFIVVGWFKCGGIFFVELQKKYKSSSTSTSTIWSLMNASFCISAFLVMTFGQSMSGRVSLILGDILISLSFLLTAFMPTLELAYFTHGVLIGFSFAFIQPNLMAMINTYFEKHRGLACNIAGMGGSFGSLAMPPVYTKLFEHFGFTGTYILVAALMLQGVIMGALMRPLDFYKTRHINHKKHPEAYECDRKSLIVDTHSLHSQDNTCRQHGDENHTHTITSDTEDCTHIPGTLYSSVTDLALTKSNISVYKASNNSKLDKKQTNITTLIKASLYLLKKRVFQYYIIINMLICSGNVIVESYIAPHAVDMGIDRNRIALLIGIMSIADICAKFLVGYLSDRKWIKRSTIMALSACALGMCSFFVVFMDSFTTIVIYAVIIGILQPVYFALYTVVAIDILSLDHLKGALAFMSLAQGSCTGAMLPLSGYIRDATGRYIGTFWLAGSILIAGGLLCYFLPNIKAYCDKESNESQNNAEEMTKMT